MAIERKFGLKISNNNAHLMDIFSDDFYLELGSIDYESINTLLSKKIVDYKSLSNFDLLKSGLGSMHESSDEMAYKLPFMHIDNLVRKNKTYQLVLTYGLLRMKRGYKEYFAPMILIPVNMYLENDNILFQMVGKPFENPYIKSGNESRRSFNTLERCESIFDLDKYMMGYVKNEITTVRLENYLTVVDIINPEIIINHDQFSLENHMGIGLNDRYLSDKVNDTYIISPLDKKQRSAVALASLGNSFVISGYEGTGKTTTLINIACDSMKRGKRVLYVSNNDYTLDYVYDIFKENGLDQYVSNLTKSFNTINVKNSDINKDPVVDKVVKSELVPIYDKIDEFQNIFSYKIQNYYINNIMKELILTPTPQEPFDEKIMESAYRLYKFEIEQVIHSLKIIDKEMPKLKNFQESHFRNIPITHQIKNVEEPMYLIGQTYDNFCMLKEVKEILEKNYGFANIQNFARFRNQINNYLRLNKIDVPKSWYSDYLENEPIQASFKNFIRACEVYPTLNEEIAISRTIEGAINSRYKGEYKNYDVNLAIRQILSNKFEMNETDKINEVLKDNLLIENELNKALGYCDDLENNFAQLKSRLNLTLTLTNTKEIKQILDFVYVLDRGYFSKAWCRYDNFQSTLNKMINIETILDKYKECLAVYNKYFENTNNIDNVIEMLKHKMKDENSKYRGVKISELLEKIDYVCQNIRKVPSLNKEYKDLNYANYDGFHISKVYAEFIQKHDAIEDETLRYQMERAFQGLRGSGIVDILSNAKGYNKAMINVQVAYDTFNHYHIIEPADNLREQINAIRNLQEYVKDVVKNQKMMKSLLKKEDERVLFDTYFTLSTQLESLDEIRNQINNNEEYKFLFEKLFLGYDTNVKYLSQLLEKFQAYITIFKDPESLVSSFNDDKDKQIIIRLDNSDKVIEDIGRLFQQFIKMFKYGVNKYYYEDFRSVINHFRVLLDNEDELKIYLKITDELKVLLKYKLYNLNNYIIYNSNEKFTDRFKYGYFKHLYDKFINKYPESLDLGEFEQLLSTAIEKEKELINTNGESVRSCNLRGCRSGKAPHLNYNRYIVKNSGSKNIFLTDTKTANLFLDISLFDIVLIDDGHLLDANEYYKVMEANQIVLVGSKQLQESFADNLTARMRESYVMKFKFRYITTPLNLLTKMQDVRGRFYSELEYNDGIMISKENYNSLIIKLCKQNPNIKINFYTSSIIKAHNIYQVMGGVLYDKGMTSGEINNFFRDNLNVADLIHGYSINADYNILDLDSYQDMKDEIMSANMANSLLCCSKKLIIIDYNGILKQKETNAFVKIIKKLVKDEPFKFYIAENSVVEKLSKSLARYRIRSVGTYKPIDLLLQYEDRYYGIMIFEDPVDIGFEVLNEYREFRTNDFPIVTIWLSDLVSNYTKTVQKIVKEIRS